MSRSVSSHTSLEGLRREARRWHRSIASGDARALKRLGSALPGHNSAPGLRTVQQALAHEYGFASWAQLKQALQDRARSHAERVHLFLEKSVNRYGVDPATQRWGDYERDGLARGEHAATLLVRHPEIAADSIHSAVAAHDLDTVRAFLAKHPRAATEKCAFDGWTPLVRLAYARLPTAAAAVHPLSIATLLLDAGADPNTGWTDGIHAFTPLVGVIGGGEGAQAAHPMAEAFAQLLIARGADPFAPQALYNTSLSDDNPFWLEFLWAAAQLGGTTHRWTGPSPVELGGKRIPSALAYLLGNAVVRGHLARARWLLAHGADARGLHCYSQEPVIKHAVLEAGADMVELLTAHGAVLPQLSAQEEFLAACAAGRLPQARELAVSHPEFLRSHTPMFAAIRRQRADLAAILLDLGMSPDVADEVGLTALHLTTHCGSPQIARLLIARGAQIDPFEHRHGGTPLTHACYHGRTEMVALLAPFSCNFRGLCFAGALDRLHELLSAEPERANREDRPGEPALFCVPANDDQAVEVAELLLSFGADPTFRNPLGHTPAEAARRRGLEEAAELLEEAARAAATSAPPPGTVT